MLVFLKIVGNMEFRFNLFLEKFIVVIYLLYFNVMSIRKIEINEG